MIYWLPGYLTTKTNIFDSVYGFFYASLSRWSVLSMLLLCFLYVHLITTLYDIWRRGATIGIQKVSFHVAKLRGFLIQIETGEFMLIDQISSSDWLFFSLILKFTSKKISYFIDQSIVNVPKMNVLFSFDISYATIELTTQFSINSVV